MPPSDLDLERPRVEAESALTSGAADHLAALLARSLRAACGLVYFVEGDRLRFYGGYGLETPREALADIPIAGSLFGMIVTGGDDLVIDDLGALPEPVQQGAHRRPGAILGRPIRDETGRILGMCCAVEPEPRRWSPDDIAALAEAAQVGTMLITEQLNRHEIDRQRRFLDAVLDSLHDGVTACDAEGRIVLVNARMHELWGDSRVPLKLDEHSAVAGLTDAQGRPMEQKDITLLRALRGERLRGEQLVVHRIGRPARHYLVDAQPIVGPDGRTLGAVQAVQDVTRRKRAERFRTCELSVITALADAPGIEAAGPRVLEAIVRTLGWTHAELWLVDDPAGVIRSAAQWSAPGWESDIEVPDELPYGVGLAGRAWQAGKPLWIRDVGRPQSLISAETAAESQLHAALAIPVRHGLEAFGVLTVFAGSAEGADDELLALMSGIAAHIGQFVERLLVEDLQRQLARTKNEYLALIGHELRTPLTSIAAYTELLREADAATLAEDGPAMLEVIERNTTQLRHIITELLELSALDAGHADVQLTPLDLADVVREAVARTREAVIGEPLTIDACLPGELVLPGDGKRLRQVVDNLLGNAAKYSPDGGHVTVTLRTNGRMAELAVSDTGIGVSPDEREKMFTGLYRTSRARDRAIPGTGLGLTLSRAVVQRHHGSVELLDHDGPGTTVLVKLPLDAR
ncbi:ATP-binding protein [Actinoplanes sp. N902-109]|uniref:sensor histidine kinase n=1 Tax=Actinoplanes sp. (strain N902-109) TaxID=649831 RepID=UPI0003294B83|nr:ATP-binding protein [Actinoplanes sp. N902-109]AGL19693.1 multi-sensor signal transduction histidine kinase [Actinoplanes sp. N902-109]